MNETLIVRIDQKDGFQQAEIAVPALQESVLVYQGFPGFRVTIARGPVPRSVDVGARLLAAVHAYNAILECERVPLVNLWAARKELRQAIRQVGTGAAPSKPEGTES